MENKDELEMFAGIGQDEINQKKEEEELNKLREERKKKDEEFFKLLTGFDLQEENKDERGLTEKQRKKIEEFKKEAQEYQKKALKEAYNELPKDTQEKISEQDIGDLIEKNQINNKETNELADKWQENIRKNDDELYKNYCDTFLEDKNDSKSKFKAFKRKLLVAILFGAPGFLILACKDAIDDKLMKKEFDSKLKEMIKNDDPVKMEEAMDYLDKKTGGICDINKFKENFFASPGFNIIMNNLTLEKKLAHSLNETQKDLGNQIDQMVEETYEEETIEEIEKVEVEENEEDPEPVEGMKFM